MSEQPDEMRQRPLGPRDPRVVQSLFSDVRFAPLWLVPRVALGWLWINEGWFRSHGHLAGEQTLAIGLMLSGIALILGLLTGPSAFVGGLLSSVQAEQALFPSAMVFATSVWLIFTWKTAGWIGVDRWLLPLLGMPWHGGELIGERAAHKPLSGLSKSRWRTRER